MIEVKGDLFAPPQEVEAICITTNGEIDRRGHAVMGRGVALEARKRWPLISLALGAQLQIEGNVSALLTTGSITLIKIRGTTAQVPFHILSLPTKHRWRDASSIALIRKSLVRIREITELNNFRQVALPRPGCQNGLLDWKDVRPIVDELLPESCWIVLHPEGP